MSTTTEPEAVKRGRRRPGDTVGGEGRPIRNYIGWDDAAGVFRQDDPALRPTLRKRSRRSTAEPAPARR
jgi:hypothetical protein